MSKYNEFEAFAARIYLALIAAEWPREDAKDAGFLAEHALDLAEVFDDAVTANREAMEAERKAGVRV